MARFTPIHFEPLDLNLYHIFIVPIIKFAVKSKESISRSINFQDLCARLLGMAALRILLLTFISRFVIDFLSIRKVIIFSAIATDDRLPLRSRSIHQNAANCMTIRFRYIAQPRGVRKTYCARSRNHVRRLTSRSNGMPSKKIMELLRTFVVVETVLRRGGIFQGSDEV